VIGKGRKERSTPLTKHTLQVLKVWIQGPARSQTVLFASGRGKKLSLDGVQCIVNKHVSAASKVCPPLSGRRVTPHVLHTTAMELLLSGIDRAMIALWLGHESLDTTQMCMHANSALKEEILAKKTMPDGKPGFYRPDDQLLSFLRNLQMDSV
jgi:site-specific recombinase XerD